MKNKLGTVLFYIFVAVFALSIIAFPVVLGYKVFEFFGNAVDKLGGGFGGVLLLIEIILGIIFALYGITHLPESLLSAISNLPDIVVKIIGILAFLVSVGWLLAFSYLGQ